MSGNRVFITGGAGFIGRNLTRVLRERGWLAHPLDNLSAPPAGPLPAGLWRADVLDVGPEDLEGMDIVVHLAASKSVPQSFGADDGSTDNIRQDKHLLRICAEAGVPRVILASSCEVYGAQQGVAPTDETQRYNPMSPYAVGKVALELHANVYRALAPATEFSCIRFFNVYGPDEGRDAVVPRFVDDVLDSGLLTIEGSGNQRRDFSYIDDVVAVLADLLAQPRLPPVINIGSGETCSVNELAALVIDRAGVGAIRHRAQRPNEIQSFCADTTLLATLLGRAVTRTTFSEGILRCIADARSRERCGESDSRLVFSIENK